jgi:ABC-type polysaccharide/polyol phosphate export permease
MTLFVLSRAIWPGAITFVGVSIICRLFIFNRHPMHWDEVVYVSFVGLVVGFTGLIRASFLWSKMERFYEDLPKKSDRVA